MRVAIEGNLGASKSTVLERLAEAFPHVPTYHEPVDKWVANGLLGRFYADPASWSLPFSLACLAAFEKPGAATHCFLERSPISNRHVFTQSLFMDGLMSPSEWDVYVGYFEALGWKPDAMIFIDTPTQTCLDRVRARARPGEECVDAEFLDRVRSRYETVMKCFKAPIVRIDGSAPPDEVARAAIEAARSLMMASPQPPVSIL